MNVLINNTTQSLEQILELLKQKIEYAILEERSIIISIMEEHFYTCLHKIYVEDYDINNTHIYLQENNFELTIDLPNVRHIEYEDIAEECFMIIHNNSIILLYV